MEADEYLKKKTAFIGIYDFSYAPYALGDAITWQMNLCVGARERGVENIVQYLVADPARPSCYFQTYITENNYVYYLDNLFPAFLCCPGSTAVHLITNKSAFDLFLLTDVFGRQRMWPSVIEHLMGRLDFSSHRAINRFFRKYNFIPRLAPPRGYGNSMNSFLETRCRDRFVVSVNIRQRRSYPDVEGGYATTAIHRDSALVEWHKFFRLVLAKYPGVVFLILGGYSTWERELYHHGNVIIPRTVGYGLAHELTLLHRSDLFIGSSSGFSAMATFSTVPYVITNFEHAASKYVELAVGTLQYPFALDNQILSWEEESAELLVSLFEPVYESLRNKWRGVPSWQRADRNPCR